jgi:hypothetical protein
MMTECMKGRFLVVLLNNMGMNVKMMYVCVSVELIISIIPLGIIIRISPTTEATSLEQKNGMTH